MKKNSGKGMRKWFLPVLLLAAMIVAGTVGTGAAYADILVWHSVHMKPGETHDISHAKANTTIYIEEPGNYTLQGSSRNVRVLIESRDTNVYLADGLDINCSSTSYTGSRTAAIWVKDNGGTVKLISKKKANIKLEGYMCPAIRKEGTKTKLVFETEDPDNPGTINANSGSRILADTMEPAAIGSIGHNTGNMTFNSGNVIAKIRGTNWGGAAIGGGAGYNASNITVNGGRVEAYGSENGAGIGAGTRGIFAGFYVNGGEVHAENGAGSDYLQGGAAIGSGGVYLADFPAPTITLKSASNIGARDFYIKGGKVTAKSNGAGAAIGGGTGMGCKNINIEGGVVDAAVDSRKASHDCYGAAIGGGPGVQINAEINISGGRVTARGGYMAPGIGSQDAEKTYDGHTKDPDQGVYRISGGTIHVQGGDDARCDIGTRESNTIVTGGNLYALSSAGRVTNSKGENVLPVRIGFDKIKDDKNVISDLIFKPADYSYGTKDVETIDGKLYVWLPGSNDYKNHAVIGADTFTFNKYTGSIPFTSNEGTLAVADNIILLPQSGFPGVEGSAAGVRGETSLLYMQPPKRIYPGFKVTKYTAEGVGGFSRIDVAEPDGTLFKNASGYTDGEGKWIHEFDWENIILREDLEPIEYQVKFDPNVPKNASTGDRLTGTMQNQVFTYDEEQNLSQNKYDLPGYTFNGWNTKADGKGTAFADEAAVKNLSDKDGDVVTLYAQWTPKTYMITYRPGNPPGGGDYGQIATFDKADTLMPVEQTAWTYPNHAFHGWKCPGFGSFYKDGSSFYNLCGPPKADGTLSYVTLLAEWAETEKIKVSITRDGVPQQDLAQYLFLIGKSDGIEGQEFRGMFEQIGPTEEDPNVTYLYDPEKQGKSIPEGAYELCFDPAADEGTNTPAGEYLASSVEISYGSEYAVSTVFDYYTVSISKDPAQEDQISSVAITDAGGVIQPSADNKIFAPGGHKLNIQTAMKEGYHFDGYSVMGIAPGTADNSKDFDPQVHNQTITVRGTADIMAHAEANRYTVKFNGIGSNVDGTMEDQDMVYGEAQELFANQFTRPGGSFALWTTNKDGSGAKYNDKESVDKLTTENGGVVNLYTQWNMTTYNIEYDLDEGRLPAGKTNPDKYWADSLTFTLNNPEKEDYDFIGWMGTGLSNPTKKVTIEEGSMGDRKYLAVWTIKTYHVDFVENGGSPVERQIVPIHEKATKPEDPTRNGYTFAGWYVDRGLTKAYDFNRKVEKDITLYAKWKKIQPDPKPPAPKPKTKTSGTPLVRLIANGDNKLIVTWNKIQGVDGYSIYFAYCGDTSKHVKTIKGNKTFAWTKSGLKKGRAYKAYVKAYVMKNGKKTYVRCSPLVHAYASGVSNEYTSAKAVTVKKNSATLKKGRAFQIKPSIVKLKENRYLMPRKFAPTFRYMSSNEKVATVNSGGKVTAKGRGTCNIYVYAHNGVARQVKITVK